jgi:hypothetical protein|tara:strand:- start:849 stop:1124 length:276 start_codon:yes stop_codon:yes gene_type:complete
MEDNNIINLDDFRRDKEEEEAEALEKEREYLGQTLRSLLNRIALVEEMADGLDNREQIRETRRDGPQDSLADSWFSRAFRTGYRKNDDSDD